MDQVYYNFYKDFYLRTGGFIPTKPLNLDLYPGDFFQIRNEEIIVLGNIFRNNIINKLDVDLSVPIQHNLASWNFSDGVSKPYSGRGNGNSPIDGQFEFSKQILAFSNKGSFIFNSKEPESIKINNWSEIQQQLILKLTQTLFSFRELYIVSESATTATSTLAIAGSSNAELELVSEAENFGLVDLFGQPGTKTIQSKDIEYYHKETNRKPTYFKAKKLVVQDEKLTVFISDLISNYENSSDWARDFFEYNFYYDTVYSPQIKYNNAQACFLDMLKSNELNPNTALLYFKWADANLDDIEKLF
jgi:hypothetical protein